MSWSYAKWDRLELSDEEDEPLEPRLPAPGLPELLHPAHTNERGSHPLRTELREAVPSSSEVARMYEGAALNDDSLLSSDDDEFSDMDGDLAVLREEFSNFDDIITYAVEDDVHQLELRLRVGPSWKGCLEYDECHGMPPLHFAALCGSVRCVRLLLEAGSSVAGKDRMGRTVVTHVVHAASMRSADRAKLLSELRRSSSAADPAEEAVAKTDAIHATEAVVDLDDGDSNINVDEAMEAAAELDSSLEQLLQLALDLVALGAHAEDLFSEPSNESLLQWAQSHNGWREVVTAARAAVLGGANMGMGMAQEDLESVNELTELFERAPEVGVVLASESLRKLGKDAEKRWRALLPQVHENQVDQSWWETLSKLAVDSLPAEQQAEVSGAKAPPFGSRLHFWEVVHRLGASGLELLFQSDLHLARRSLSACCVVCEADAERVRAEAKLASIHYSTRAALRGDTAALRLLEALLSPSSVGRRWLNATDRHGEFALKLAASHGSETVVGILLNARANPNIHGGGSIGTALQAAAAGGHLGVARLLLESRADPNHYLTSRGKSAGPALLLALHARDYDMMRVLLQSRADPSVRDSVGKTLLELAQAAELEVGMLQLLVSDSKADAFQREAGSAEGEQCNFGEATQQATEPEHADISAFLASNLCTDSTYQVDEHQELHLHQQEEEAAQDMTSHDHTSTASSVAVLASSVSGLHESLPYALKTPKRSSLPALEERAHAQGTSQDADEDDGIPDEAEVLDASIRELFLRLLVVS